MTNTELTPSPAQTQTGVTERKKIDVLKDLLSAETVKEVYKNALNESRELFIASVIDLYNTDSKLQECQPRQVVQEALKAATMRLPINKALGFAYLVPYKSNGQLIPQFQLGYKGFIQLAMRTGQYKYINADLVYEGELRNVSKLTGEIDFSGDKTSDKVVGYFAYIEMLNGFSKTLYMSKEQVMTHAKKYSKSYTYNNTPWQTEFDAMAKKTVVRNLLSHYGYLSVEMIGAIVVDRDDTEDRNKSIQGQANMEELPVDDVSYEDVTPTPQQEDKPAF